MSDPQAPTLTQFNYKAELDRIAAALPGPVLQIGARSQVIDQKAGERRTWRDRCAPQGFVGADLEAGPNVDAVFDICWPMDRIEAALLATGHNAFGAVLSPTCWNT